MTIAIAPVTPDFVAEIGDVDLSRPLSAEDLAAIKEAFFKYAVLIFPNQHLDQDQHLGFAANFGPLERSFTQERHGNKTRIRPELSDISNLNTENKIWAEDSWQRLYKLANRLWHADSSFKKVPAQASLLYARVIPPIGGQTEFADCRAAYDALPDDLKQRIDGLIAEHAIMYSRAKLGFLEFNEEDWKKMPPVPQVLVRTIPETGRKSIYIASHAGRIIGLPEKEGQALIESLMAHTTQRQFVYSHRWRQHDLVMWDNRTTLHRATQFEDLRHPRDLQRATVSDIANTCEQAGIAVPA